MKSSMSRCSSRREFLRDTLAVGGAVAAPYLIPGSALGLDDLPAASERITMGCIGLGGRGTRDMEAFLSQDGAQIVALCDVDAGSTRYEDDWHRGLAPAKKKVEETYGARTASGRFKGVDGYSDFRDVLARGDIDAVCIATPDHWHAPIAVAAAKVGKDMYCEKPLSLTIADGRAMVDAVTRYDRVFQCGSQRRAIDKCRRAAELVRNGRIGKLHTVHVGLPGGHWMRKNAKKSFAPEPVPDGFDYDLWLGPAPWAPYTFNRCHWNFRWNLDYSGGNVTDWGAHMIDVAHWGMGRDQSGPVKIEGKGTFPPSHHLWNAATAFEFTCTYDDGVKMIVKSGGPNYFEGTEGTVNFVGKANPAELNSTVIGPDEVHLYETSSLYTNFLECVKSRGPTAAPVETAHRSISVAHLGNIAMRVDRPLRWDPKKEEILDDPDASRLLGRAKRAPWTV